MEKRFCCLVKLIAQEFSFLENVCWTLIWIWLAYIITSVVNDALLDRFIHLTNTILFPLLLIGTLNVNVCTWGRCSHKWFVSCSKSDRIIIINIGSEFIIATSTEPYINGKQLKKKEKVRDDDDDDDERAIKEKKKAWAELSWSNQPIQ